MSLARFARVRGYLNFNERAPLGVVLRGLQEGIMIVIRRRMDFFFFFFLERIIFIWKLQGVMGY